MRAGKTVTALFLLAVFAILQSCSALRQKATAPFTSGEYILHSEVDTTRTKVYALVTSDSINVYPIGDKTIASAYDSKKNKVFLYPPERSTFYPKQVFRQTGIDFDVLTIPFKYRPYTQGFPNQFNTNLNGAFYLGTRTDTYEISYKKTPLGQFAKNTAHYAFGLGVFAGLGSTFMNEWVTQPSIDKQYDGVVFTKGIAGILGIGNLNFGLTIGFDHLLDANHHAWIYQGKPWTGISIGLNLN